MSFRFLAPCLMAGALALAMGTGCGDDASPTGNGGTGSTTLSIPAGSYAATGEFFVCGEQFPYDSLTDTLAYCSSEIFDDFFGYDCAIKRNGNALSLSCERTEDRGGGCTETVKINVKGTVTGSRYELSGTFEYSDNPADCWDGAYCDSLHLVFERLGNAPTACTYADENTVNLTVAGGPQAGKHILNAFGSSNPSGGSYAFSFSANSGSPVAAPIDPAAGGGEGPSIYMSAQTSYIDPQTLPATLTVVVLPPGERAAAAAGGPEVTLSYYEYSSTASFSAESVVSGNFVVHELDGDHIAGTLNVTVGGTAYNAANPGGVAAQRTLTGGYFVTDGGIRASNASGTLFGSRASAQRRTLR